MDPRAFIGKRFRFSTGEPNEFVILGIEDGRILFKPWDNFYLTTPISSLIYLTGE